MSSAVWARHECARKRFLGRANASVYCATKAAILGLSRAWARELAPRILVNAVAPGPTDTALLAFVSLNTGTGATFITVHCMGATGGAAMN
jgi:3-oxoacyl-[acyl-carrier protein] reductase